MLSIADCRSDSAKRAISCRSPMTETVVGHRPAPCALKEITSPVSSSISNRFAGPRASHKKLPGAGDSGATRAVMPRAVRGAVQSACNLSGHRQSRQSRRCRFVLEICGARKRPQSRGASLSAESRPDRSRPGSPSTKPPARARGHGVVTHSALGPRIEYHSKGAVDDPADFSRGHLKRSQRFQGGRCAADWRGAPQPMALLSAQVGVTLQVTHAPI